MMDWTDRHCRVFHRALSRRALLYTEMLTTGAVLHGDRARLLGFDPVEHPVALQLGGSEPAALAEAVRIAEGFGYDEINLNVGCPSDRVQSGRFGACLMAEPDLVARCVEAMLRAATVPVTVKSRIGIDDQDEEAALSAFVGAVSRAGCDTFVVHARKAWLRGLSPKENREIPPLRHERVHRLKQEFPHLTVVLNGGLTGLPDALPHLAHVDGVMFGRAAYQDPYLLATVDRDVFGEAGAPAPEREAVVDAMIAYAERARARGAPIQAVARPMIGLFRGRPGGRAWRRHLSEAAHRPGAGPEVLADALARTRDREAVPAG